MTRTPTPFGLFEEHPRADREFVRPFFRRLQTTIDRSRPEIEAYLRSREGEIALSGLRLLNVQNYITGKQNAPNIHLGLEDVSPIIVSERITPFLSDAKAEDAPHAMVDNMGLDMSSLRCRTILTGTDKAETLPGEPTLKLLSHAVEVDRAEITFQATADAFCRLAYGYYPNLSVRLDGRKADTFRTADGFIGLRIPEGKHTIEISGRLTPLRRALLIANTLLLLAAIYWVYRQRTHHSGRSNGRKAKHPVSA